MDESNKVEIFRPCDQLLDADFDVVERVGERCELPHCVDLVNRPTLFGARSPRRPTSQAPHTKFTVLHKLAWSQVVCQVSDLGRGGGPALCG